MYCAPLVRVVDHLLRLPPYHRHGERLFDQFGAQMGLHRPAHNQAAPGVQDHGHVQPARLRADIRQVRHPELIRSLSREVPVHQVRRGTGVPVPPGEPRPSGASGSPPESRLPASIDRHASGSSVPLELSVRHADEADRKLSGSRSRSARSFPEAPGPGELDSRADVSTRRSTHWGRDPTRGTSPESETGPGAPLRTRILSGDRVALPGEPSRGFF